MSNRYKVLLPLTVSTADGSYTQGDEFDMDYTASEEADVLAWRGGGMVEIVPAKYKVIGPNQVYGTDPGETFEAALTVGQQQHLIDSGNIERAAPTPTPRRKKEKEED
jgi:hypothetical protein